jgi:hypothetical protein
MPPFNQNPDNFNKDNPNFEKVGPLSQDPATAAIVNENNAEFDKQNKEIEDKIRTLEKEIRNLEDERRTIAIKKSNLRKTVGGSDLYKTAEGNLVASLPRHHSVIESIENNERLEKLKVGMKNLLGALKAEEENRKPVLWDNEEALNKAPEDVRALVTLGSQKSFYTSWENNSRGDSFHAESEYIMSLFSDLFTDIEKIKQINFCNQFELESKSGFSGVAVFYEDDLYLIMKNGKRIILTNTHTYKTYPQITKYGPDFAGCNKTESGRFLFTNYLFRPVSSSAGHDPSSETKELTTERIEDLINSGKVFTGIDPDTHYDADKRCIVIGQPLF